MNKSLPGKSGTLPMNTQTSNPSLVIPSLVEIPRGIGRGNPIRSTMEIPSRVVVPPRRTESKRNVNEDDGLIEIDIGKYRSVVVHRSSQRTILVCWHCHLRKPGRIEKGYPYCLECYLEQGYDPVVLASPYTFVGNADLAKLAPEVQAKALEGLPPVVLENIKYLTEFQRKQAMG